MHSRSAFSQSLVVGGKVSAATLAGRGSSRRANNCACIRVDFLGKKLGTTSRPCGALMREV